MGRPICSARVWPAHFVADELYTYAAMPVMRSPITSL
jgi:hypothetical protein